MKPEQTSADLQYCIEQCFQRDEQQRPSAQALLDMPPFAISTGNTSIFDATSGMDVGVVGADSLEDSSGSPAKPTPSLRPTYTHNTSAAALAIDPARAAYPDSQPARGRNSGVAADDGPSKEPPSDQDLEDSGVMMELRMQLARLASSQESFRAPVGGAAAGSVQSGSKFMASAAQANAGVVPLSVFAPPTQTTSPDAHTPNYASLSAVGSATQLSAASDQQAAGMKKAAVNPYARGAAGLSKVGANAGAPRTVQPVPSPNPTAAASTGTAPMTASVARTSKVASAPQNNANAAATSVVGFATAGGRGSTASGAVQPMSSSSAPALHSRPAKSAASSGLQQAGIAAGTGGGSSNAMPSASSAAVAIYSNKGIKVANPAVGGAKDRGPSRKSGGSTVAPGKASTGSSTSRKSKTPLTVSTNVAVGTLPAGRTTRAVTHPSLHSTDGNASSARDSEAATPAAYGTDSGDQMDNAARMMGRRMLAASFDDTPLMQSPTMQSPMPGQAGREADSDGEASDGESALDVPWTCLACGKPNVELGYCEFCSVVKGATGKKGADVSIVKR